MLSEIQKVLPRLHTAPALCKIVLHGLHHLFDQPALSRTIDSELYNAQQHLLWMSLFDRIVNNKWSEYQDNHFWDKKMRTHSSTGDQWTVQIIKFFCEKFFALLKLQNEKVHGTDEKATYKLKVEQYRTTIKTMFHLCDRLEAADCQYMFQLLVKVEEFLKTKSFAYMKVLNIGHFKPQLPHTCITSSNHT